METTWRDRDLGQRALVCGKIVLSWPISTCRRPEGHQGKCSSRDHLAVSAPPSGVYPPCTPAGSPGPLGLTGGGDGLYAERLRVAAPVAAPPGARSDQPTREAVCP